MQMVYFIMLLFIVVALFLLFLWWQTNSLVVTQYTYANAKIPKALRGYCIAQVSDLHNKSFGKRLIQAIAAHKPNIIVITGDFVSRSDTNIDVAKAFIKQAVAIAPVYYVTGNHEAAFRGYAELTAYLDAQGVTRLDNTAVALEQGGAALNLIGLLDPAFYRLRAKLDEQVRKRIEETVAQNIRADIFNLLLAHRPSLISSYAAGGADLVLSGHAHGGQIRLPLIGALIAPDEGFFPTYANGVYHHQNTTLVVSRGLGDSRLMPVRLFNRPELVVIRLQDTEESGHPTTKH